KNITNTNKSKKVPNFVCKSNWRIGSEQMRITNIHIFAFGKHENLQLTFGHHINVLYGENEAGKTTIQQFILHVLFGFPPRNHSLLRYEPLHSNTYGGQVHIEDEQYGCVVEER